MAFAFTAGGETITVGKLSEQTYALFNPEASWKERESALARMAVSATAFCVGLKEANKTADRIHPPTRRGPQKILSLRAGIKDALIQHAHTELDLDQPAFAGRGGNGMLCRNSPPILNRDGRVWATLPEVWDRCVGGIFNDPFNYIYTRAKKYQAPPEAPLERFVPMIAVFDTAKMQLVEGNVRDKTSWRPLKGETALGCLAGMYFFDPHDLTL